MDRLGQEWVLAWHSVSWICRSTPVSERMRGYSVHCQHIAAILLNISTHYFCLANAQMAPSLHSIARLTFPQFFLLKRKNKLHLHRMFSVWEVCTLAVKEGNSKHLFPLALFLVQKSSGNRPHTWQASQSNSLAPRNASVSVNGSSVPLLG